MINIYYMIWVDCLNKLRSIPANKSIWKFYGFAFISMAMAMNIALFMAIFQRDIIGIYFYKLNIDFFPGDKIDSFCSFFILYLLLPIIVNYFLIYYKQRYLKLFVKYQKYIKYNGRIAAVYLIISYFLPIVLILIGALINKMYFENIV